ncbi:MAG: DUF1499 domain-containing protein [Gammaproteobacteria bacterium]|nr:DUF1499 domain-containing protein [Gammaproteobacteria bacterium]
MKLTLYLIIVLVLVIGGLLASFSLSSRKQIVQGITNERLQACPESPNCVCSEYPDVQAFIEPLRYSIAHADAWQSIKSAISHTGGKIVKEKGGYIHAQFYSTIFRFIDDVELRMDENRFLINVRSASRVGRSDLGVNRKRIEKIRKHFESEY